MGRICCCSNCAERSGPASLTRNFIAASGYGEQSDVMARFLLLFRPRLPLPSAELIGRLDPLVQRFHAVVEHRSPAHLSAMVRG